MASNYIAGQDVHFDYVPEVQAEGNSNRKRSSKTRRGKNVKMQAKLNRPGDDYPTSRVIRQDANGNVIVSELSDDSATESGEKSRHMHCCRCGRCLTDSEYEEEEEEVENGDEHNNEEGGSEKIAEYEYEYDDDDEGVDNDEYEDEYEEERRSGHGYRYQQGKIHEDFDDNHGHSQSFHHKHHQRHLDEDQYNDPGEEYSENEFIPGSSEEGEYEDEDDVDDDDDYMGFDGETDDDYEENEGNYHYRSHERVHGSSRQSLNTKRYLEISVNRQRMLIARCLLHPRVGNYLWRVNMSTEDKLGMRQFWMEASEQKKREIASVTTEDVMRVARNEHDFNCNCRMCGNRRVILERELLKLYSRHRQLCGLDAGSLDSYQVNYRLVNAFLGVPEKRKADKESENTPDSVSKADGKDSFGEVMSVAEDLLRNQGEKFINTVEQFDQEHYYTKLFQQKTAEHARNLFKSFMKVKMDKRKHMWKEGLEKGNSGKARRAGRQQKGEILPNEGEEPGDYYEDQMEDEENGNERKGEEGGDNGEGEREREEGDDNIDDIDDIDDIDNIDNIDDIDDIDVDDEHFDQNAVEGEKEGNCDRANSNECVDNEKEDGSQAVDPRLIRRMEKLERRLVEITNMLQLMTAKLLVSRLIVAYKYKVAEDNRNELLQELEDEEKRKKEKEEKERKRKEKQKEKKRLQQQAREQEKKRREAEKLEKEKKEREEQIRKAEEGRKRKEAERKKKREEEMVRKKKEKEKKEKERKKREEKKKRVEEAKKKKLEEQRKLEEKKRQEEEQRKLDEKKKQQELQRKRDEEAKKMEAENERVRREKERHRLQKMKKDTQKDKQTTIQGDTNNVAQKSPANMPANAATEHIPAPPAAFGSVQAAAGVSALSGNASSFGSIGAMGNSAGWNLPSAKLSRSPFAMHSNGSFSADPLSRNPLLSSSMTASRAGSVDMLSQYLASATLGDVVGDNKYLETALPSTNPLLNTSFFGGAATGNGRADIWGSTAPNSGISSSRKGSIWGNSNPQLANSNKTLGSAASTPADSLKFSGLSSNILGSGTLMPNWSSANKPSMNNGLDSPLVPQPLLTGPKMGVHDAQRIQLEILKAAPNLPTEKNGFYSIPLLYHYSKSLLSSLLPNLSFDQFIDALSVPLNTVVGASFQVAKDDLGNFSFVKLIPNSPAGLDKHAQQLGMLPPGLDGRSSLSHTGNMSVGASVSPNGALNKPLGFGAPAFADSSMPQSMTFSNAWSSGLN